MIWLCFAIGPENSLTKSEAILKPTATWSPAFSRASSSSPVLLSLHIGSRLGMMLTFALIGCFKSKYVIMSRLLFAFLVCFVKNELT